MPFTILVADDNVGTRLSVSDYLEMLGYIVIRAENGEEALSLIDKYHPHLLVADINMPKMDGYQLVRHVRAKPAFRLLPVIFLTERGTTEERIMGYQLGCDLYLPKPFEMQELGAVIRSLLERSQIMQAEWRMSIAGGKPIPTSVPETISNHQDNVSPEHEIVFDVNTIALSEREQQVLNLLTQGLSNSNIGKRMHLSPRTIEKYVSSILRKTGKNNRSEVIRFALQNHLVD
ncbi:MAG TPA: DNA-binding response regulator [Cyanobacteria bacterium UBA11149]|nr:DNA-binding response regulator [Cyanobacteria bacterium UBA11367]HBE56428.1 DNA-binding response regulator [Cyanobacteria bacterium UBA11366]HBK66567.1 DNA-binding response regulator [Cyanobacteria bacterium UBA11166]HBR72942.1 DNA-binding response regulator [Cyanobacteria bacterium UBA11159]HBS70909.1 DNA-binding response regulator [Cyanobacteria bacterium UBA11153]HBW89277.1 DNA-binding response regulator [Cyanobacteria bacterium UBA11149]HCA97439.1 DNA-binding response regulator [Cyanob